MDTHTQGGGNQPQNPYELPLLPQFNINEDNDKAQVLADKLIHLHQEMQQQLTNLQETAGINPLTTIANAMQTLVNAQSNQAPRMTIHIIGMTPSTFDGSTEDVEHFWHEVVLYLLLNTAAYDTEHKCTAYILGLMKRGTKAGAFAQNQLTLAMSHVPMNFGDMTSFKIAYDRAFRTSDAKGAAKQKLTTMRQGAHMVDEYNADFIIQADHSGITEYEALVDYYQ
ncbi:hypothetical protein EW145_g5722 [Phellinidium pouzarii]|uniref:Retrotransposon gag domain-containing protein n=1 Tax=Phellinidium pouzarii TaxID=167371 RepID=A0A4S4L0D3_9AGAM|nr:hypothetical protein EW145_g5722 [Phellinidium pouzarii]